VFAQGSNVASAGTITLGNGGYFNVTGTTAITDIDFTDDKAGRLVWLRFAGILTLTHNASTLILPTGANITTAAGDMALFVSEGADAMRCLAYTRADGSPLTGGGGSSVDEATASVKVGSSALGAVATPYHSVAAGNAAGERLTTVYEDVFIGYRAGRGAVAGTSTDNVGIGADSLESITNAVENVAVGAFSGFNVTTGDDNTLLGYEAGFNLTTGSNNVFVGQFAGSDSDLATGSSNVFIGYHAGSFDIADVSNTLLIDSNVTDLGALIYGEFDNRLLRINGFLLSKTKVAAKTADYTLTTNDSGGTFTNEGTPAKHVFTLPTAAAGLNFKFIVQDADGLRVTANTGDTIRLAGTVSASAGFTEATTIGNVVRLEAINNTEWIATTIVGTWTTT
jgi:hypothetical protein